MVVGTKDNHKPFVWRLPVRLSSLMRNSVHRSKPESFFPETQGLSNGKNTESQKQERAFSSPSVNICSLLWQYCLAISLGCRFFGVSSVSRMERVQDGAQLHVTMRSILLLASSACHTIYWSRHVYVRCGGRIECAVSASQLFRARHGESFSLSLP